MDSVNPFQSKASEESEIRQCANVFFNGGNPSAIEELKDYWKKWSVFFEAFVVMRDSRYGNILHLPFSGGVFEQPCKTMKIFQIIQSYYLEKLQREQNKALGKIRNK